MPDKIYDSIIFDMDGTLWDAVESYCQVWDVSLKQMDIDRAPVTRQELIGLMGNTIERIVDVLVPQASGNRELIDLLDKNEEKMMLKLGGRLYDGARETVAKLAETHKLFMVSNCSALGLPNFLTFTGLTPYITDTLSYGDTHQDKAYNINELRNRYSLRKPLYVGDTLGDYQSCLKAGVDFAWASYGFGNVPQAKIKLNNIRDLLNYA